MQRVAHIIILVCLSLCCSQPVEGQEIESALPDTIARVFAKSRPVVRTRDIQIGDTKVLQSTIPIDAALAHPAYRYGLIPFVQTEGKHIVLSPHVIDGEAYHNTQVRYMGFELSRDSFYAYLDTTTLIRQPGTEGLHFTVHEKLKVNPEQQNVVKAYRWIENYTQQVVSDTLLLSDGYPVQPMRWLDYSIASVPIDAARYARKPQVQPQAGSEVVNLRFEAGKAQIAQTDTVGLLRLDRILAALSELKRDTSVQGLTVHIHGVASPEGRRDVNQALGLQRSRYVAQYVSRQLNVPVDEPTRETALWTQVADSMAADALPGNAAVAEAIRQICKTYPADAQEQYIRRLPAWPQIQRDYLPRFRKVYINYQYVANRSLTPHEVCQLWERGELTHLQPYMYGYLFEHYQGQPAQLEPIASRAYQDAACNEDDGRPWALAAYHLAQCYLQRDTVDTVLLKPYIETMPTMAATQVQMLTRAKAIYDAYAASDRYLPDKAQFAPIKILLDGMAYGWNKPAIREAIAKISPWNRVVVYAAQDEAENSKAYWQEALEMLSNPQLFPADNPKVLYMKAVLRNRLEGEMYSTRTDGKPYPEYVFTEEFGVPMVDCISRDTTFLSVLQTDGEFNQMYREGFLQFWNKESIIRRTAPPQHTDATVPLEATRHILQPRYKDPHMREWAFHLAAACCLLPANAVYPSASVGAASLGISHTWAHRLGLHLSALLAMGENALRTVQCALSFAPLRTLPLDLQVGAACGQILRTASIGPLRTFYYAPTVGLCYRLTLSRHLSLFLLPQYQRACYAIPYANRTNEKLHLADNIFSVSMGLHYRF